MRRTSNKSSDMIIPEIRTKQLPGEYGHTPLIRSLWAITKLMSSQLMYYVIVY